jgi:hypothetical protein
MACRLVAAALLLAGASTAIGEDGTGRSTFRPRAGDPPAALVVPVQAKTEPVPPAKAPDVKPPEVRLPEVPPLAAPKATQDPYEAYIRLDPPGRERLFGNRDSERELEERMRQERRDSGPSNDPIQFPEKPKLTDEAFQTRKFTPMVEMVEPNAIVYRRLYFEEKNSERYGWDLGPIQPLVSTLVFYKDLVCWPHNIATHPHRRFETNAGQCMPGDPVPYTIYPPELTGSGLLAEVGMVALLFAAVP